MKKPIGSLFGLRDAAAEGALRLLRQVRSHASPAVERMLAYVEEHLFDEELTVEDLKRACGPGAEAALRRFHHSVGLLPKGLVDSLRMRTAAELLRSSDLHVHTIASLVASSSHEVFSQRFQRWTGFSPTAFRKSQRAARHELPLVPLTTENLEKALRSDLGPRSSSAFLHRFFAAVLRRPKAAASLRKSSPSGIGPTSSPCHQPYSTSS